MNLQQIISSDLAARLGWTLLHSLWQGAAVALVLAAAMRLLRFHSPPLRYSAALGSLAVLLIAMCVTFARSGPVRQDQFVASATIARVEASAPSGPPSDETAVSVSPPISPALPRSSPSNASRWSLFTTRLHRIVPYLACAWGLGVVFVSLWHTGGWIAVQRLRRLGVESVDAATAQLARAVATRLEIHRVVRVVQSLRIETPLVVGWLRPMILLPAAVLAGLTAGQLEAILAHELAHIRRHDYLLNLVQVAIETLLFYHPAVWWISRRIRLEREQCCDDIAVAICGDRCRYVESLAALEEVRMNGVMALAARGAGGSEMVMRVRRILGARPKRSRRPTIKNTAATSLILVVATIAACTQLHLKSGVGTDDPVSQGLLRHLEAAENAIHNLKVEEFELTEEFLPDGASEWQKTPISVSGTAWYGDPKDGTFRMNKTDVLEWLPFKSDVGNPDAPKFPPFSKSSNEMSFDGTDGHTLCAENVGGRQSITQYWGSDDPGRRPSGDNPLYHEATGATFSLSFMRNEVTGENSRGTLSQSIRFGLQRGAKLNLVAAKIDGTDVVQQNWNSHGVSSAISFDPQHGFALGIGPK